MSKGWGSEEKICSEIKSRFSTVRGTRMTMAQLRVYPDLKGHSLASTVYRELPWMHSSKDQGSRPSKKADQGFMNGLGCQGSKGHPILYT